jgi:ADP-heptose:LPS heptosyltransferase
MGLRRPKPRYWGSLLFQYSIYRVSALNDSLMRVLYRLLTGSLAKDLRREISQPNTDFFESWLPNRYLLRKKFTNFHSLTAIYKRILAVRDHEVCRHEHLSSRGPRYLIIRTGALGDVIMVSALVAEIFERHKGKIHIDVATNFPQVFLGNPKVRSAGMLRQIQRRQNHYDLILDLDNVYEQFHEQHPITTYSHYLFGAPIERQVEIFFSETDRKTALEAIGMNVSLKDINHSRRYVMLHSRFEESQPFRGVDLKLWNAYLSQVFRNQQDLTLIYVGDQCLDVCEPVHQMEVLDARGRLTLAQTVALMSDAVGFIGTDAGPLHMAAATKTPIVSFFTHVPPDCRKPFRPMSQPFLAITPDLDCRGCTIRQPYPYGFSCERGNPICASSFEISKAAEQTRELLKFQ